MRSQLFRASVLVTVLLLAAASVILADGLPEPDINVADYKSPPSAELLNLFDPNFKPPPLPARGHPIPGGMPPPPPPGASSIPPAAANANKGSNKKKKTKKKSKSTKLKKQGAAPTGAPTPPASTGKGTKSKKNGKSNKNKKKKSKSKKKKKKRVRNMGNSGVKVGTGTPRPPMPRPPQFDQGEVDPAIARKMNRGPHPPPPPFAADPASKNGHPAPPPPPFRRHGGAPPPPKHQKPAKELSYAELRAQQQKLYEEQRRRYAQLVKFHTEQNQQPPAEPTGPPPSLDELRTLLHKDGLTTPPPFDASAQAGFDLPPETDMFSTPPPRMREYDLPPVKAQPKWKKNNSTRRKNRIKQGMVEQMAHFNSLSRQQEVVQAQKAIALEKMRESLINNLQSDKTTQQLRSQIESLLHEEIAKMSKEEVAAELEHILKMKKEQLAAGGGSEQPAAKSAPGSAQAQQQQQQQRQAPPTAKP